MCQPNVVSGACLKEAEIPRGRKTSKSSKLCIDTTFLRSKYLLVEILRPSKMCVELISIQLCFVLILSTSTSNIKKIISVVFSHSCPFKLFWWNLCWGWNKFSSETRRKTSIHLLCIRLYIQLCNGNMFRYMTWLVFSSAVQLVSLISSRKVVSENP